jgi:hypothetical protein
MACLDLLWFVWHVWIYYGLYGPQLDRDKVVFLNELRTLCAQHIGPWFLCSDFNMLYKTADQNNSHLNPCLMGLFHRFIQDMELEELHLHGLLYTWSNERGTQLLHALTVLSHACRGVSSILITDCVHSHQDALITHLFCCTLTSMHQPPKGSVLKRFGLNS